MKIFRSRERPPPRFTVGRFFSDRNLLGRHFEESWTAHVALLKAAFGESVSDDEREVFLRLTGRSEPPSKMVAQLWLIAGRGSGKSRITAGVAIYMACAFDWKSVLAAGEPGVIMVIATDRKQARIIFRYVEAMVNSVPMLASLVVHRTAETVEFSTGAMIEVHTCSFRSIRGGSLVACLCDELAFWRDENSANPDGEVIRAAKPGLARVPGSMLIGISSPYRKSGELWKAHQKYYGKNSDKVLVVKAATRELNPTLDQSVIDDAMQEDPESARTEWMAEFRADISSFLSEDELRRATRNDSGLPPRQYVRYRAAVDMSGGRNDQFGLAIGHRDEEPVVIDGVWGWPARSSVASVVSEMAAILGQYGCAFVRGDKYGAELTRSIFQGKRIEYVWAEHSTSDVYLETRVLFSTGRISIPNHPGLLSEFSGLERRPGSGKDRVDHPPGQHDDLAAAASQCAFECWKGLSVDMSGMVAFDRFHLPSEDAIGLQAEEQRRWAGSIL